MGVGELSSVCGSGGCFLDSERGVGVADVGEDSGERGLGGVRRSEADPDTAGRDTDQRADLEQLVPDRRALRPGELGAWMPTRRSSCNSTLQRRLRSAAGAGSSAATRCWSGRRTDRAVAPGCGSPCRRERRRDLRTGPARCTRPWITTSPRSEDSRLGEGARLCPRPGGSDPSSPASGSGNHDPVGTRASSADSGAGT